MMTRIAVRRTFIIVRTVLVVPIVVMMMILRLWNEYVDIDCVHFENLHVVDNLVMKGTSNISRIKRCHGEQYWNYVHRLRIYPRYAK